MADACCSAKRDTIAELGRKAEQRRALIVVMVIVRVSYGTRMTNGALIQIHADLDESAHMCGATTGGVIRRVLLPLLAPALAGGVQRRHNRKIANFPDFVNRAAWRAPRAPPVSFAQR